MFKLKFLSVLGFIDWFTPAAAPTNTFLSTSAIGNREDLID